MNLIDPQPSGQAASSVANPGDIVSRYLRLRSVGRVLGDKLVKRLSKDELHEGGRKLGILRRGTFVFNNEQESAVLMDYCLFDVRRKGRNVIEQYLIDSPPAAESDEMKCLEGMQRAFYSLFVVDSAHPRLGVIVSDLLSQREPLLIVDMGFSKSAPPGFVFLSRLLQHDGFFMTSGAALPLGQMTKEEREVVTKVFATTTYAAHAAGGSLDPAPFIRECLRMGVSSKMRLQDPSGKAIGQPRIPEDRRSAPAGRNSPCPCGSGRKYKHCCLQQLR